VMLKESHAIYLNTDGGHFYFSERYLASLGPWVAVAM
jgi:hypothetical protein